MKIFNVFFCPEEAEVLEALSEKERIHYMKFNKKDKEKFQLKLIQSFYGNNPRNFETAWHIGAFESFGLPKMVAAAREGKLQNMIFFNGAKNCKECKSNCECDEIVVPNYGVIDSVKLCMLTNVC